jgi:hypothetical protein
MKTINLFGLKLDKVLQCSRYYKISISADVIIIAFDGFNSFDKHFINIYLNSSSYIYSPPHNIYASKDTILSIQDTFDKDCTIILKSLLKVCKINNLVSLQEKLSKYEILL